MSAYNKVQLLNFIFAFFFFFFLNYMHFADAFHTCVIEDRSVLSNGLSKQTQATLATLSLLVLL